MEEREIEREESDEMIKIVSMCMNASYNVVQLLKHEGKVVLRQAVAEVAPTKLT